MGALSNTINFYKNEKKNRDLQPEVEEKMSPFANEDVVLAFKASATILAFALTISAKTAEYSKRAKIEKQYKKNYQGKVEEQRKMDEAFKSAQKGLETTEAKRGENESISTEVKSRIQELEPELFIAHRYFNAAVKNFVSDYNEIVEKTQEFAKSTQIEKQEKIERMVLENPDVKRAYKNIASVTPENYIFAQAHYNEVYKKEFIRIEELLNADTTEIDKAANLEVFLDLIIEFNNDLNVSMQLLADGLPHVCTDLSTLNQINQELSQAAPSFAEFSKAGGNPNGEDLCFQHIFRISNESMEVFYELATHYIKAGELDKGEKVLNLLLHLNPEISCFWESMVTCHHEKGNQAKAVGSEAEVIQQHYDKAMELCALWDLFSGEQDPRPLIYLISYSQESNKLEDVPDLIEKAKARIENVPESEFKQWCEAEIAKFP